MRNVRFTLLVCLMPLFSSCEKAFEQNSVTEKDANVVIRIADFQQLSFEDTVDGRKMMTTRSAVSLSDYCDYLQFVVFDETEKLSSMNQKVGDEGYGHAAMKIAPGSYTLMVLAHKAPSYATVSSLTKVTFPGNQVGDTFLYCGAITVEDNKQNTFNVTLGRCVSMFRLCVEDNLPDDVAKMKFYYTGGSSTLDVSTGWGNVNSRQTVNFDISAADRGGPAVFEVFTFPHEEYSDLKMTVTALDAQGQTLCEKIFEKVPIQRNRITQYKGVFFGSGQTSDSHITVAGDTAWTVHQTVAY